MANYSASVIVASASSVSEMSLNAAVSSRPFRTARKHLLLLGAIAEVGGKGSTSSLASVASAFATRDLGLRGQSAPDSRDAALP